MRNAKPLRELRKASEEELVELHDSEAKLTAVGVEYYLNELEPRIGRIGKRGQVKAMRAIILVATLIKQRFSSTAY